MISIGLYDFSCQLEILYFYANKGFHTFLRELRIHVKNITNRGVCIKNTRPTVHVKIT